VFDYVPKVNIRDGMKSYVDWYLHEGKAAY